MLIQNTSSTAQAPQPARLSGDGGPVVAGAHPAIQAAPVVALDLPQTAVKPAAEQQPTPAQLQSVVDNINKALQQSNKNLEFTVDTDTEKPVVKLVDSSTGDVIRQYPTEEALSIAKAIEDIQQGMLFTHEA